MVQPVAPSTALRKWYAHDPERFEEFSRRYQSELTDPERAEALQHLRDLTKYGNVTLLTATKHADTSEAAVLADLLRVDLSSRASGAGIEGSRKVQAMRVPRDGSLPLKVQAGRQGAVRSKRRWLGAVRNIDTGGRQAGQQEQLASGTEPSQNRRFAHARVERDPDGGIGRGFGGQEISPNFI